MVTKNIYIVLLSCIIVACSKENQILKDSPPIPLVNTVKNCRTLIDIAEQGITKAGVKDTQDKRIANYPYLRINRFLSSYRNEVNHQEFSSWIELLQQLGIAGWTIELNNLPSQDKINLDQRTANLFPHIPLLLSKLSYCSDLLSHLDFISQANRHQFKQSAVVASVYNTWQRVLGLYPLTAIPFRMGISRWQQETRETFNTPLSSLPIEGKLVLYVPEDSFANFSPDSTSHILKKSSENPLHIPFPSHRQQQILFSRFAPRFEIDTINKNDKIGAAYWSEYKQVLIDTNKPTVYQHISHTRINDKALLQLNYMVWFPSRPKSWSMDLLGGHLDGIIWRVTISSNGKPLIFDSIHSCGCYHLFFTSQNIQASESSSLYKEPVFSPQSLTVFEGQELVIRISAHNHFIQKIYTAPASSKLKQLYHFEEMDALRSMDISHGQHRSLYNPLGFITATERSERYLFWPMGIPNSGAMRQWGKHATAFIGRRHFDEAHLIEDNFELLMDNTVMLSDGN